MQNIRVVFITIPTDKAEAFAQSIVEQRLAACVNVVPGVKSYFWWDDKVQNEAESLLIVKTTVQKLDALTEYVKENHPYDVPELIAMPVSEGLPDYINWLIEETGKG